MNIATDVWTDPELKDLVRTDPGLVAIADALTEAARQRAAEAAGGAPARGTSLRPRRLFIACGAAGRCAQSWGTQLPRTDPESASRSQLGTGDADRADPEKCARR